MPGPNHSRTNIRLVTVTVTSAAINPTILKARHFELRLYGNYTGRARQLAHAAATLPLQQLSTAKTVGSLRKSSGSEITKMAEKS